MTGPVKLIVGAIGAILIVLGIWALVAPMSFYDTLATYPPYNEHLFHDIGAFQIGLGLALVLPVFLKDLGFAALVAVAAGMVLHAVSHFIDKDLGGKSTDPYTISALAAPVVIAAILHVRRRKT